MRNRRPIRVFYIFYLQISAGSENLPLVSRAYRYESQNGKAQVLIGMYPDGERRGQIFEGVPLLTRATPDVLIFEFQVAG
jgi:hypothetical protein